MLGKGLLRPLGRAVVVSGSKQPHEPLAVDFHGHSSAARVELVRTAGPRSDVMTQSLPAQPDPACHHPLLAVPPAWSPLHHSSPGARHHGTSEVDVVAIRTQRRHRLRAGSGCSTHEELTKEMMQDRKSTL